MGLRSMAGRPISSGFLLPELAVLLQMIGTGRWLVVAMPALQVQNVGRAKVLQTPIRLRFPVCLALN